MDGYRDNGKRDRRRRIIERLRRVIRNTRAIILKERWYRIVQFTVIIEPLSNKSPSPPPPPPITNVKLVKYRVIAVSLSFTNSSSFTWCYYFLSKLHFIFEILLIILCNNSTTLPLSPQAFPLKFIDKWPLEFPFHVSFVFITTFVSLDYSIILIDRSIEPSSFCLIAKN